MNDLEYKYLRRMILKFVDIDIDLYKSKQMRRRLGYLVDGSKAGSVVAFCHHLEDDPELVRKLKDFLTINVSEFFRDHQHFTNLKTTILPELLRRPTAGPPLVPHAPARSEEHTSELQSH